MNYFIAVLLSVFIVTPCLRAEESAPASTYLEELQTKLEHMARRANQPTSSGSNVAGLRGSKQEPISKQLYWKGKTTENPVSIDEVKMFRTGVEEARAGKKELAMATLKSFLEKYPQSRLKPDVEETLKVISASPSQA